MLVEILILVGLTLIPFLELRASIPYGIFNTNLHWGAVFGICVITNIVLGAGLYAFFNQIIAVSTKIKPVYRIYSRYIEKNQKKIKRYIDRYGELGVALFIGVPLPGSGVYSGAIGAYMLGLDKKRFLKAAILGVLIAGTITTLISISGINAFNFLIKKP